MAEIEQHLAGADVAARCPRRRRAGQPERAQIQGVDTVLEIGDPVGAAGRRPDHEMVGIGAAGQRVAAAAGDQRIIAGAAVEEVIPVTPIK